MADALDEQAISGWERACRSAWPLRFIDINQRGIGQVIFQNNPLSGLFFFAAIGALLATIITVLVQGAMVSAVTPFAVPTLTASFVLVTWLFLLAKRAPETQR